MPVEISGQILEMLNMFVKQGMNVDDAIIQVLTQILNKQKIPKEYLEMLIRSLDYSDKED